MKRTLVRLAAPLSLLAALGLPRPAHACGGTFCDVGPTSMPVDQTGENVLFVMGSGIVEAHVQIQYQGDPERFAWVVPMQRVPDISVGSQALFDAVMGASVPSYGFTTQQDPCPSQGRGVNFASDSSGGFAEGGAGPTVLSQKQVGSFETATLQGGTAAEIVAWLDTNGYQQSDAAPSILQKYVDKGFVFVAVKLTAGAGIDEIHPLVFSYTGGEPCVPLELTAIAAVDDMRVRTFFLGQGRVVPTTYRHVVVNPLAIDWLNFGANYPQVVSAAVDVKNANGQAFVTEYAGPSEPARNAFPSTSPLNRVLLTSATPDTIVTRLSELGLVSCSGTSCNWTNPLVRPTLMDFLPPPAGTDPDTYYSCVSCLSAQADLSKWDAALFAQEIDKRVVQPAVHAEALLTDNPYLTRLFTLISPHEMTKDPEFREEPTLSDVPLPGLATRRILCDGQSILTLPDGRQVFVGQTTGWPVLPGMSPAERVEDYSLPGAPEILTEARPAIDDALEAHNDKLRGDGVGCGCTVPGRPAESRGGLSLGLGLAALLAGRRRRSRSR